MLQRSGVVAVVLLATFARVDCRAVDRPDAKQSIPAAYVRSVSELKRAKSIEDLDAIHAWMDTSDWVSIQPGQPPQTWEQMRSYGFQNLFAPFSDMRFDITSLQVRGNQAILLATFRVTSTVIDSAGQFGAKGASHVIVMAAPLRETWIFDGGSWRRQRHEKLQKNSIESVDGKSAVHSEDSGRD